MFILGKLSFSFAAESERSVKPSLVDILQKAVVESEIAYMRTTPEKLKELLGKPEKEQEKDGGGMMALFMGYPDIEIWFGKSKQDTNAQFKLRALSIKGKEVDIGGVLQGQRQIIVRNIADFHDTELKNVNLTNLDLS